MSARVRKAIGGILMLAFLVGYVGVVVALGDKIPNQWLAKLAFFGLAGFLWGAPLIPLIRWMNRGG
jgi:hypothetical protein